MTGRSPDRKISGSLSRISQIWAKPETAIKGERWNIRICEANSAAKLQRKVNRLLEAGYIPAGGVAASPSASTAVWWYYQAMTKSQAEPEGQGVASKPLAAGFGDFD